MTLTASALGLTPTRRPRTLRSLPAFRFARARLAVLFGGACLVLTGVYVVLVNQTTAAKLKLDQLATETRQLREENNRLELMAAQAQSVDGAGRAATLLGLTPVAKVEYLSGTSDVASAR